KYVVGGKGSDHLQGSSGKDVVTGRQGDDWLHGGAGNDVLAGDSLIGGKFLGWLFGGCWHGRGGGNDWLDGGAGSDLVLAGKGNDFANYTWSENLRSRDVYDGGKGFDTLQLTLTHSEFHSASVQQDIAAFQKFLDYKANPHSDHGKTFHFKSFDLDARNFEALKISVIDPALSNAAPTALDDAATIDEDSALTIAAPRLLANDTDPDQHDVLTVKGADALSTLGVAVVVGADGSITYDSGDLFQNLADGESIADSFDYTITDLGGATATASVQVTVTGVNDAPVAMDDAVALNVSSGGGGASERTITFEGAIDALNVDGFQFEGFSIFDMFGVGNSYMAAAGTTNNNAGGGSDADGAVRYGLNGQEFGLLSLSIASFNVEPTVDLIGYRDGEAVPGAEMLGLTVNAAYQTINFDAAWGSIDELRIYGHTSDVPVDYLLIDDLRVSVDGGAGGGTEAAPIDIDVLANDSDVDQGAVLELLSFDETSAMGATVSLNPDGTLRYDPAEADDLQALARGETMTDTFEYTVSDGNGGTDVATVSVALLGDEALDAPSSGLLSAPDVDLV
ncbi:MAG TPA: Ig-like domain-containing protein, partial [Vicinamibacterales bacterium]|nr:Ig-like domain-containing protein [Vicinamibacterales bacterium]